jgi:hypothetical protein
MGDEVISKQYFERRTMLDRLRTERAALELAIEAHQNPQLDARFPWDLFDRYKEDLNSALIRCKALISELEIQLGDE